MKILYIAFQELTESHGISKKIMNQTKALSSLGFDVQLFNMCKSTSGELLYVVNGKKIATLGRGFIARLRYFYYYSFLIKYILVEKIKCIYIRYTHFGNPFFLFFLKKISTLNIRIYIEIPTYPYDAEFKTKTFLQKIKKNVEFMTRQHFYKYVNKVITFSNDDFIFKMPAIKISNGINFDEIKIKKQKKKSLSFNIIAVANLADWHGYDRVIMGLKEFYSSHQTTEVFFYIVGGGDKNVISNYKSLIEKSKLDFYVKLLGPRSGENLDILFDEADFAIGCLGCHRKKIENVKSLKNVEYAARGIPFMYSEVNTDFDEMNYIYKASPNENAISIDEILEFTDNLNMTPIEIRNTIYPKLSWEEQLKGVYSDMLNENKKYI